MEIIVAKNSGFCGGVLNAITKTEEFLKYNKAFIKGDIVHNEYVIDKLNQEGLINIEDFKEVNAGSNIIIRAHGERKEIFEYLKEKNVNIIDLTCPKVKKIHNLIKDNNDKFIIFIGKKNHPEVSAHISYAENYMVIDDREDINLLHDKINTCDIKSIYIIAQTTFNENLFNELVNEIKITCQNINIEINKTICDVTQTRQEEIRKLSKRVDKMIIIGSNKSSNTTELFNIAKENCQTYLVNDVSDLNNLEFNKNDKIGIGAGASTPRKIIDSVKNYLQNKEN